MTKSSCLSCLVFLVFFFRAKAQGIQWQEIQPGIWKAVIGQPGDYDLLKAAGSTPYTAEQALSL